MSQKEEVLGMGNELYERGRSFLNSNPNLLLILLVGTGILLRTALYSYGHALWADESTLALNLIRTPFGKLTEPLPVYYQIAPLGFLYVTKWLAAFTDYSEIGLRFLSYASGVVSIFCFYKVARFFANKIPALIALTFFVFSETLVRYSAEFKPYSLDVLITLVLLLTSMSFLSKQEFSCRDALNFSGVCLGAIFFSFSSIFIICGIVLTLYFRKTSLPSARNLTIAFIIFLTATTFYFKNFCMNDPNRSILLHDYWNYAFVPLNLTIVKWSVGRLSAVFYESAGLFFGGLSLILFFLGLTILFQKDRIKFKLILLPILITLAASALRMYPFAERLLLFLTPLVFIALGIGIERLSGISKVLLPLTVLLLLSFSFQQDLLKIIGRPDKDTINPAIHVLMDHYRADDEIYVYYGAEHVFEYYAYRYKMTWLKDKVRYGQKWRENKNAYKTEIDRLANASRTWFLFSHVYRYEMNEEDLFVSLLDKRTNLLSFKQDGGSVYLYR